MRNISHILPPTVTGKRIVAFPTEEQCILVILIGSSLLFHHPFIPRCCETEQLKRRRIAECRGKDIVAWLAPKWVKDTKSYGCICLLAFLIHLGLKHSLASTLQNHTKVTRSHSQMTPFCYQYHVLPIKFSSFCLFTFKSLNTTKYNIFLIISCFFPLQQPFPQLNTCISRPINIYIDTIIFC